MSKRDQLPPLRSQEDLDRDDAGRDPRCAKRARILILAASVIFWVSIALLIF